MEKSTKKILLFALIGGLVYYFFLRKKPVIATTTPKGGTPTPPPAPIGGGISDSGTPTSGGNVDVTPSNNGTPIITGGGTNLLPVNTDNTSTTTTSTAVDISKLTCGIKGVDNGNGSTTYSFTFYNSDGSDVTQILSQITNVNISREVKGGLFFGNNIIAGVNSVIYEIIPTGDYVWQIDVLTADGHKIVPYVDNGIVPYVAPPAPPTPPSAPTTIDIPYTFTIVSGITGSMLISVNGVNKVTASSFTNSSLSVNVGDTIKVSVLSKFGTTNVGLNTDGVVSTSAGYIVFTIVSGSKYSISASVTSSNIQVA
jgi:hypothetical protein